jgi:hypothetical protein
MSNQLIKALENKASFECNQELLQLNPDAVEVQGEFGNLPLHYALFSKASDDVIKMLFQAYPQAIEVPKDNGDLPFLNERYLLKIYCGVINEGLLNSVCLALKKLYLCLVPLGC